MISTFIIFAGCVSLSLALWVGISPVVRLALNIRALNAEIAAGDAAILWRNRWDRQMPWPHVEKDFVLDGKRYILSYDYCTPDGSLLDLGLPIFNEDGSISPQEGQEGLVDNITLKRHAPLSEYTIETMSVVPITTPTGPLVGDLGAFESAPSGWK